MSPSAPGQGTRPTAKTRFCRPGALTGRPTVIPRLRSSELSILVIGSYNTDLIIKAAHIPKPGETILGGVLVLARNNHKSRCASVCRRLVAQVFNLL